MHFGRLAALVLFWAVPLVWAGDAEPVPVLLETEDGVTLHADHRPAGEAAVVLLHMYRSTREAWAPIVERFAAAGMTTLAIDMRGHGESTVGADGEDLAGRVESRDPDLFRSMWRDAQAAVTWLEQQGHDPRRIGLLGASVGCSVAFDAAHRDERLRVVGVLTPGTNYLGISTLDHLAGWGDRETLIVSSTEEALRGAAPIIELLGKDPSSRVTYWELEESRVHGTRMFGQVDKIEQRIVDWFAARLATVPGEDPSR